MHEQSERTRGWVWGGAGALVATMLGYAWWLRFLCDDAYISFRHAENLLAGNGLVFNAVERVEGITNFLWTLQIAAIWGITGLGPGGIALFLGMASTGAMLVVFVGLARSSPLGRDSAMLLGLLLLACNHSIAVWSTSGLEQRQFTLFMLAAIALVHRAKGRVDLMVAASFALVLAELSRPEVLLFAGCLGAWVVVDGWRDRLAWRSVAASVAALLGPFALMVALHTLARWLYYGALLPNTYYAKGKEIWPEAGLYYLAGAAVEHGMYLVLPLALVGFVARLRHGDRLHLLSAFLIVPHLAYLVRIGGDHFEYRMLDLAFVLVALAAADGLAWLGQRSRPGAAAILTMTLFSTSLIPLLDLRATSGMEHQRQYALAVPLVPEAGALAWVPGVTALLSAHDHIRAWEAPRMVATRRMEHTSFHERQLRTWQRYRLAPADAFPKGLVMKEGAMGVTPFCLRGVTVIDLFGLTDATIARMAVKVDVPKRRLAHPRRERAELDAYVDSRVNVRLFAPASSLENALRKGPYAIQLTPAVWMPFEPADGHSVASLGIAQEVFTRLPDGEGTFVVQGRRVEIVRVLDDFETAPLGWKRTGAFVTATSARRRVGQGEVVGHLGGGLVNSYHPTEGDAAVGQMVRLEPVVIGPGEQLGVWIGGGDVDVGLQLDQPGQQPRLIHGHRSTVLSPVAVPIEGEVWVSVIDHNTGAWGHVLVDSLVVLRDLGPAVQ